jgi:carbon-monoxide dehydrogenase small subunit
MTARRGAAPRRRVAAGGAAPLAVAFTLNGRPCRLATAPNRTLLELLREELGLVSVRHGCGRGECGACTVLLDGRAVNACLVLAPDVRGAEVTTVEGLAGFGGVHPLQRALVEAGAVRCGHCTPGLLLRAAALLAEHPAPTAAELRAGLAGNICRCGGHAQLVRGVALAAPALRGAGPGRRRGRGGGR